MTIAKNLLIAAFVAGIALAARYFFPDWGDDNFVEETAEYVIEEQTGLDIDLSPGDEDGKK